MQGTPDLQRRWLQQNPFAGAVLDDPTLPLPRFIRDTPQQPQQPPAGTSRKAEPVALRDALQQVKVLAFLIKACESPRVWDQCGAPRFCEQPGLAFLT